MKLLALLPAAALLVACAPAKPPAPPPPQFNTHLTLKEVMGHVVDPAAQAFWHSSGFVATREGVTDLLPTTDAGWLVAENAAASLNEAGNALQAPGRAPATPEWNAYAARLSELGVAALAAADARSEEQMMKVGAELDEACDACHMTYMK
jgi:cytochrome c556